METFLLVTDLCGREKPFVTSTSVLPDLGFTNDHIEHILNTLAEEEICYLGEWSFEPAKLGKNC